MLHCCSKCATQDSGITSAEEAFDAKGFEDYLLDEVLIKKPQPRTKRQDHSKPDVFTTTTTATATPTTVPLYTPLDEVNKTVKIVLVQNGSLARHSVTFTNLTHFTDYEISVSACLSPRPDAPGEAICSTVKKDSKIRHKTDPLRKFIVHLFMTHY